MFKSIKGALGGFRKVEKPILNLIVAVLFVQLIDASFFLLFNYYLRELHYTDSQIAIVTAYRYVAIMLLAFPLGIFIKGRRLKPFFQIASVVMPLVTLWVLYAVENHQSWSIMIAMILYGVSRLCLQVAAMPFIILNGHKDSHSEGLALYFQTFSISVFLTGLLNYGLSSWAPEIFDEKRLLQLMAIVGFCGFYFVQKIKIDEKVGDTIALKKIISSYDWSRIFNALIPTILTAVGAGFTIPFINLFFQSVHGIDSQQFSLIGSFSFVLVAIILLFIPMIQRRIGYRSTIVGFQSLAILALFVMASTEWYNSWSFALPIAIGAYLVRQPLMNVAGPSTSELALYYVGERNQEMVSALQAAIWSGSWFISSILFGIMRELNISYANIFMITVGLYVVATFWYSRLVTHYERNRAQEEAT